MTTLIRPHDAQHWNAEADAAEEAAKRYAMRGMDVEVRFFTAKARDCRDLANEYRAAEAVTHQLAAE